jgi:hypothetical protein
MESKNWLTGFLKRLLTVLSGLFGGSPATNSAGQPQFKRLTRYIFQSGHFSTLHHRVKQGAFLPQPPALKISSIWIDLLGENDIWTIGDLLGATRKPIARASFDAEILPEARLAIEPDPAPHPRHVNIFGWPAEKDAQKAVALFLCNRSSLQVRAK